MVEQTLTNTQKAIISVWQEVLNKNEINLDDDFAAIGGQSLDAVKIAFKCQKLLNKRVTTSMVIRNKTVRAMAEGLD